MAQSEETLKCKNMDIYLFKRAKLAKYQIVHELSPIIGF